MIKSIKEIFTGVNGDLSSKRVVTFICVLLMAVAFLLDLIMDLSVPQFMFEAVMYIIVAGIGFSGAEHFAKSKSTGGESE